MSATRLMSSDVCAFILTHGRPDNVYTFNTLKKCGFTGKIYIVIDDEDKTQSEYIARYGDDVKFFSKSEIAKTFDEGDNFNDRRAIIYARNYCFKLAKELGHRYFIQLDDDYTTFNHTISPSGVYLTKRPVVKNLSKIIDYLIYFMTQAKVKSIAFSQAGDFIGGASSAVAKKALPRKAMNSFICDAKNPFQFVGKINEDVNTYTYQARKGLLLFTFPRVRLEQKQTQSNAGGMTELYIDSGTYIKSFYSVMYAPSCVKVKDMGHVSRRLHHSVDWNAAAPKIINDKHKKNNVK